MATQLDCLMQRASCKSYGSWLTCRVTALKRMAGRPRALAWLLQAAEAAEYLCRAELLQRVPRRLGPWHNEKRLEWGLRSSRVGEIIAQDAADQRAQGAIKTLLIA